jgi:hypothetical protein
LFTSNGLLTLAAAAVVMWALGHFGDLGRFLRLGVFWGLLFGIVRQAARGEARIEPPEVSDVLDDVFRPALLGALATAIVWVPALACRFMRPGGTEPVTADPVYWLIAVVGVLYAPMAFLHAAMGGSALRMLNPIAITAAAVRLGGDYLVMVGVSVLLVIAGLALDLLGGLAFGDIPVLSSLLRELLGLIAPLVLARSLGLLLYVRGDAIGLGLPEDYLEPVMPGVAPRGSAPSRAAPETTDRVDPAGGAKRPAPPVPPLAPGQAHPPAPALTEQGTRAGASARIEAIELDPP